jgi:hypothetical protein
VWSATDTVYSLKHASAILHDTKVYQLNALDGQRMWIELSDFILDVMNIDYYSNSRAFHVEIARQKKFPIKWKHFTFK